MTGSDTRLIRATDLGAALGLLTRLPVTGGRGAAAAWAWPVAGAVVGAIAATAGSGALWLGLAPGVAAALVIGVQAMVTGAMHEDGLADTADGLWGGWDKARRLAIMKDSHIGSYGVMALLVVGLARWSALTALLAAGGHWPVLLAAGMISRVPMAVIMAALPNARGAGLAAAVGRPSRATAALACAAGLLPALLLAPAGLAMVLAAGLAGLAVALVARARIGGQTGDILGASQQMAEAAALAVAA